MKRTVVGNLLTDIATISLSPLCTCKCTCTCTLLTLLCIQYSKPSNNLPSSLGTIIYPDLSLVDLSVTTPTKSSSVDTLSSSCSFSYSSIGMGVTDWDRD